MQLSKALTADTPEDRLKALCDEMGFGPLAMAHNGTPEAIKAVIIEQFYLNERKLFIDLARYGPRTPTDGRWPVSDSQQSTGRPTPPKGSDMGERHQADGGLTKTASGDGKGGCTVPGQSESGGSRVPVNTAAPESPEAVQAAIDALKLDASLWLHGPLFGRWMDLRRPDRYPPETVARLAALRALTLPQLKYLKDGEGRPPI